jgi:tRNA-splicing ligase RtcB
MIKKINDFLWEIEKEGSMNVPIHIYANEAIVNAAGKDRSFRQSMNAASLPSIVKHMVLMPDVHEGYGLPVGGVVAFDAEEGIVSPGAVGYDINCLHPDTKILSNNGTWVKIKEVPNNFNTVSFDTQSLSVLNTKPILVLKKTENNNILKIRTKFGNEILVTNDHPMLTKDGMVLAKDLKIGLELVVSGFEGIEYKQPNKITLVNKENLLKILEMLKFSDYGNAKKQIINYLDKLDLSNLDTSNEKLSILLKLLGLVYGDGNIQKNGITVYYGKPEDLSNVKKDIEQLGFSCNIFSRKRHSKISTKYGISEFENMECSLHVASKAFGVLLATLGAPVGSKALQKYSVPYWILNSENWQKRLFLAAYFGAEMTKPMTPNGYNFTEPSFSVSKLTTLSEDAVNFLKDIKYMLECLSIKCVEPKIVEGYRYKGKNGETVGFRLSILSNTENIMKFFSTVSYVYNEQKTKVASLASLYLKYLQTIRLNKEEARNLAITMYSNGSSYKEVAAIAQNEFANQSFIEHAIWSNRKGGRVWNAIKFNDFCNKYGISESYAYDTISEITKIAYKGEVYDLTINDKNHNFVANSFVVSNCGVRLIKTNLTVSEVRPKLSKLMDTLMDKVPSGVGSKIDFKFSNNDLEKVAVEGVRYAIEKGFGFPDDIDHIEEYGVIKGADFDEVSPLARKRGLHQLGTLGAGNHFVEVQRISEIFDAKIAKGFGLEEGNVTILIHSGSRGFGHQICSDYLRSFSEYQQKNNLKLPDPELSYAYVNSKEADSYLKAMRCAVNFAFTNRQIMTNSIRKGFEEVFGKSADALGMELLYDVAHNIAKLEEHLVDGKRMKLYVHRKGATRAFGPGRDDIPKKYRELGQPVLIPGSMGSASYVLAGRSEAMAETFGSSCHGSGRVMSRHQAIREIPASRTLGDLKSKGIEIRVRDRKLISEEAEWAYKSVDDVVQSIAGAKISNIVAKLVPLGVTKG